MNELTMTLYELKAGQSSIIIDYRNGEPSLLRRLIEMGFALGEPVKLLRKSPFKSGPVIVEIRNTIIGLGKEESDMIEVEGAQDA